VDFYVTFNYSRDNEGLRHPKLISAFNCKLPARKLLIPIEGRNEKSGQSVSSSLDISDMNCRILVPYHKVF